MNMEDKLQFPGVVAVPLTSRAKSGEEWGVGWGRGGFNSTKEHEEFHLVEA